MKMPITSTFFALALLGAATAHATSVTHGTTTVSIDFVDVGNKNNTADSTTYGAVDHNYRIGKYEISEAQWDAVSGYSGSDLLDDPGYWTGNQPVAQISWNEAAMFCNWLTSGDVTNGAYAIDVSGVVTGIDRAGAISTHGRVYVLPTENEWYKAAYYDPNKGGVGGYWDYPTQHDSPSLPDGIDSVEDTAFDAVFNDGYNQGSPNDVTNAGVLSAYGTMGQGGNVWEWNETAVGSSRGRRGGGWGYLSSTGLSASYRLSNPPTDEDSSIGFRVASVPEPSSIALLVSGLGTLLLRRRRRK